MVRRRYQRSALGGLGLLLLAVSVISLQAQPPMDSIYFHTEKEISADTGGVLSIAYDGLTYAYFGVSPKTIDHDVRLTIDTYFEMIGSKVTGVAFDFGPDGLQFSPPYAVFSLERPFLSLFLGSRVAIYDEYGNMLWQSDVIDESIRRIVVRFKHFSLYYFERR